MTTSSSESKTHILDRVDSAVILALTLHDETGPQTLAWDKPPLAANSVLSTIHMLPVVREKFLGSSFMMLKLEAKVDLVLDSIRRLVRQKKIVGYDVYVPTMNTKTKVMKSKKARRYRPVSPLEALARL